MKNASRFVASQVVASFSSLVVYAVRNASFEVNVPKQRLTILFLIVFTNMVGAGVIIPILPLYAVDLLGATTLQSALVIGAFPAAQFIAAPWIGRLSDRFGRRPVLIISQIGTVLSYLLFIYAVPLGQLTTGIDSTVSISGSLAMVFLGRLLDGITGGNITVAQAYASDISTNRDAGNRAQTLGIVGGASGLGFLLGPAFGGLLAGFGLTMPFVGAALITAITLLLTIFALPESIKKSTQSSPTPLSNRDLFANRTVLLILAIVLLASTAFMGIISNFALYADHVLFPNTPSDVTARNIGLLVTVFGILTAAGQLILVKPLNLRFGEPTLITGSYILYFVSLLGVSLLQTPSLVTFLLMFLPAVLASSVSQPSLQSLITRFGDAHMSGRLLGLLQAASSLGLIFGPLLGGYVFQSIGPAAIFQIGAGLLLIVVVMCLALRIN